MNSPKPHNPDEPMPVVLRNLSFALSIALLLAAVAISWWWFPDSTLAKLVAVVVFFMAAPPVSAIIVLEIANKISRGELKRTGKLKP